jgi:ABC-type multidrug transport system fused ATPase/permease subunit
MENISTLMYFKHAQWSTREYFKQLCSIDMAEFYDDQTRNEINRITGGSTWQIPNTAGGALRTIYSTLNTVATIIALGALAWWVTPFLLIMLIPVFLYESKLAKIGWFVWDEKSDEQHVFWGLQSIFTQAKQQFEIRALTATKRLLAIATSLNHDFYKRQANEVNRHNLFAAFTVVVQVLREGIAQAWLIVRVIGGALSLENYFFSMSVVFRLDGALSGLISTFARIQEGLKYSNDYRSFLGKEPTLIDVENAHILPKGHSPKIEFINATFTYPGAKQPAINNLSLIVEPGQKTALIGENGAGKSTIIKLLMRFYLLDSGKLLIDGVDIRDLAIEQWYKKVATLFQDFNKYPLTVEQNIAVSGDKTVDKDVKRAALLSGSASYIDTLPQKFKTYLDPAFTDGVEPSGGQWQRIALARAFYRQADMIILDEPTSAIDAKAEYEIFNNIFSEHNDKTALIVSHRFSTVRKADRIVVLEKGAIAEDGTHKQLLDHNGMYASMFNKQAEGYR